MEYQLMGQQGVVFGPVPGLVRLPWLMNGEHQQLEFIAELSGPETLTLSRTTRVPDESKAHEAWQEAEKEFVERQIDAAQLEHDLLGNNDNELDASWESLVSMLKKHKQRLAELENSRVPIQVPVTVTRVSYELKFGELTQCSPISCSLVWVRHRQEAQQRLQVTQETLTRDLVLERGPEPPAFQVTGNLQRTELAWLNVPDVNVYHVQVTPNLRFEAKCMPANLAFHQFDSDTTLWRIVGDTVSTMVTYPQSVGLRIRSVLDNGKVGIWSPWTWGKGTPKELMTLPSKRNLVLCQKCGEIATRTHITDPRAADEAVRSVFSCSACLFSWAT